MLASKKALKGICDECYRRNDCDKDAYGYCPNFMKVWNALEKLDHIKLLIERHNDGILGCTDFVFEVKEVLGNGDTI